MYVRRFRLYRVKTHLLMLAGDDQLFNQDPLKRRIRNRRCVLRLFFIEPRHVFICCQNPLIAPDIPACPIGHPGSICVERKEVHRHIRYSTVASTLPIAGGKLPPVLRADGTLCPMGEARIANKKPNPWLLAALTCCAAIIFTIGISWGLPSRSTDPFLFGDHSPWTGKQILALAPGWGDDANRAADVAAHPLANRDQPIVVNQTDSDRAAIVRRYRLYSDQPDEMITLRALAQMQPGKLRFDPKLYQYGGLWFYPIGGILKLASLFHLVRLTPDLAFYLDHPDAFGRLYVIMRLYSAAWGLLGLVVMFSLAARITGSQIIGAVAGICYAVADGDQRRT
jgi:hypothetical protein